MRPTHRFGLLLCLIAIIGAWRVGRGVHAAPPATSGAATPPDNAEPAVRGTVTTERQVPLEDMVVYLESPEASRTMPPPGKAVDVSQKGARFEPRLVVVTVGQTVNFLNDEA